VQLARNLHSQITNQQVVLTIGKFDGMHLGHQLLINTTVERARQLGLKSAVLTFDPHPDTVVHPERELRVLTSTDERIALIAALQPDILLIAPFTRETMATPAADYMRQVHAALPLRELWVGNDFVMGRRREGDIPRLIEIGAEIGYAVGTVAPVVIDGQRVSSTRARELLAAGQVAEVLPLLGRHYWISGPVVEGDKRGRTIGFPTANLAIAPNHMLPADGVYACYVYRGDERHRAVTNVGIRPTFAGLRRTVEAHLFDFDADLYGQVLRLAFVQRLRGEQKFSGIAELVAQIGRDAALAREILEQQ
jgi:riboflavin kinase/FMN adenylyltransferase